MCCNVSSVASYLPVISRKWLLFQRSQAEQVFLCVASLLSQGTIWTCVTVFKITQSERRGHHHSLLYTFKDTLENYHIIPTVNFSALNSMDIVPLPHDPHEKNNNLQFLILSRIFLQASLQSVAYQTGDKKQRRKICGRAGISTVHVSDTTLVH